MQLPFVQGSCNLLLTGSNMDYVQASESSSSLGKQPAGDCNAWYPSFAMTTQIFKSPCCPAKGKCIFHPGSCLSSRINAGEKENFNSDRKVCADSIIISSTSVFFSDSCIYKAEIHLKELIFSTKDPYGVQMKVWAEREYSSCLVIDANCECRMMKYHNTLIKVLVFTSGLISRV